SAGRASDAEEARSGAIAERSGGDWKSADACSGQRRNYREVYFRETKTAQKRLKFSTAARCCECRDLPIRKFWEKKLSWRTSRVRDLVERPEADPGLQAEVVVLPALLEECLADRDWEWAWAQVLLGAGEEDLVVQGRDGEDLDLDFAAGLIST